METIKGYIQEQVEMRFTTNGTPISTIRISLEKEEIDFKKFQKINAWEQLAEVANEVLQPNDFVYAKGYWKTRTWEDAEGKQHSVTEFTAKQMWRQNEGVDIQPKDILELSSLPVPDEIEPGSIPY